MFGDESGSEGAGEEYVFRRDVLDEGGTMPLFTAEFENYIKPDENWVIITASPRLFDYRVDQLANDCMRTTLSSQLLYPWEVQNCWNIFAQSAIDTQVQELFSHQGLTHATRIDQVIPAQTTLRAATGKSFAGVISRIRHLSWPQQLNARRAKAMLRWRFVLEENLQASKLGNQLQLMALEMKSSDEIKQLVEDTLHDKSTSTLDKRGHAMIGFAKWHRLQFGTAAFPINEERVYQYVRALRTEGAKPTKAAAFVSALNFSGAVFDLEGAFLAASSVRVKGAANSQFLKKRPLQQRRKLCTDEVRMLENLVDKADDPRDRIAAGFFCCQLYSRARFSDLQFSSSLIDDLGSDSGGFLEFQSLCAKTSVSKESKTTFMPLVATAVGLLGSPWGKSWLDQMVEAGLVSKDPYDASLYTFTRGCVLPENLRDGSWGEGPTTCSEAGVWLVSLLRMAGATNLDKSVGTHSLKVTPLAWCAMYGLSIQDRELLGHHSLGKHLSAHTYSRDSQARPLQLFQGVISAIKAGSFDPDNTRSGRFNTKRIKRSETFDGELCASHSSNSVAVVPLTDLPNSVNLALPASSDAPSCSLAIAIPDEASSSSNESSESDSSDSDESVPEFPGKGKDLVDVEGAINLLEQGVSILLHSASRVVHFRPKDEPTKLKCGRTGNLSYVKLKVPFDFRSLRYHLLCKQCFGR